MALFSAASVCLSGYFCLLVCQHGSVTPEPSTVRDFIITEFSGHNHMGKREAKFENGKTGARLYSGLTSLVF